MVFQDKLKEVQDSLKKRKIAGWLLYDYHGSNPLAYTFLEIPAGKMTTRRFFYWIPQQGNPIKIVPLIEPYTLDHLPGEKWTYRSWQDLDRLLLALHLEQQSIAMEYSPYNALPVVSKVDSGTVDLIRRCGAEVVSSADLLQKYTSVWRSEQLESHLAAARVLDDIVNKVWTYIGSALHSNSPIDEYQVQQFILDEMGKERMYTADPPTCAVNEHSADPHYSPREDRSSPIRFGDFILLDLWCKQKGSRSVYADITRVGVASDRPTTRQQEIFEIVKKARDGATQFLRDRYVNQQSVEGWEVDQYCRDILNQTGYGEYFIHRTGHNIGEQVHGPGANLDNFETHDFRQLIPGTCYSIEPGIYLPNEFGVRLEYNVYLDASHKLMVTGGIQNEITCLK